MKFYAVRLPIRAIFTSWPECNAVVSQARFSKFKSFPTLEEARVFMEDGLVLQEQPDGDGEEQQQEEKDEESGGEEDDERGGNRENLKQESACAGGEGGEGGGGGGGGGGGMGASSSVLTAGLKQEKEMSGGGRDGRKRKATAPEAGGKKCVEGGGGGEVISLLSDSGEEDQDEGLRGGQKKRAKSEQVQAEEYRDEEEDRNSDDDDDDDDDERFEATQTIPASPLLAAPTAPPLPPLHVAAATAASAAASTAAAAGAGLAAAAARVITSGTLFFDGGSRGNPGVAGCGAVMYDDLKGKKAWSLSAYLGHNKTNNQAEYAALCFGLEEALKRGVSSIQAFGDSTLVVKQVEGVWKVKNAGMKVWHAKALALKSKFKRFRISFVPREENGVADGLANEGMDGRREGGAVVVEEG